MTLVPNDLKVLQHEPIDPSNLLATPLQLQLGELIRLPLQLTLQRLDMVAINMGISHLVHKLVRDGIGDMGDHVEEEGVGGDVEGYTEAKVGGTLVHEAGEEVFGRGGGGRRAGGRRRGKGDVKLAEHVAGGKGHLGEVCRDVRRVMREVWSQRMPLQRGREPTPKFDLPAGFQALRMILLSIGLFWIL